MPLRPFLLSVAVLAATAFVPALAAPLAVPVAGPEPVVAAPHPYDEAADAHAQLDAALAESRRTGKHALIEFGANWCPDCRVLAGITGRPEIKPWLDANYVTLLIDTGRHNKNMDIAEHYGLTLEGVPTVLVLSADGTVQNRGEVLALGDPRTMAPQAVVALLARWCGQATATN